MGDLFDFVILDVVFVGGCDGVVYFVMILGGVVEVDFEVVWWINVDGVWVLVVVVVSGIWLCFVFVSSIVVFGDVLLLDGVDDDIFIVLMLFYGVYKCIVEEWLVMFDWCGVLCVVVLWLFGIVV